MKPVKNPKRVAAGIKAAVARKTKRDVLMQITSDDDIITSDDKHVDTNPPTQHKIIIGSAVLAVIATIFMWRTKPNYKPDDEQPSVVIDPFEFN